MVEARTNRRLAAILAADVVGYSRLMANDEISTLEALKRHREVVFDPEVSAHGGRIFKLMGDGTLVEFASVVDAVKCAVAIQTKPFADNIKLRIGINLGDVIIEGDDIYGDGVNIATRLETLAEPGGICVSSIVNESIGKRIEISFEDGGEVLVKNIDRPIRVWKWHGVGDEARQSDRGSTVPPAAAETNRSIAVLPFTNMSGSPDEEYSCDGMTEDIITDLSKNPKLVVIARISSFAYKGKSIDIRLIGRELGVGSVLEGSVRRAADRVRVNAQLIDAESGAHIWAERYDRAMTDIFTLQDDLTHQIVDALKITLSPGETPLPNVTQQKSIIAHDLMLRARALIYAGISTREKYEEAQMLLQQALERDPECAEAYALRQHCSR
jgi:adenylate cyclase